MKISPMTSYYVRRLLRQQQNRLMRLFRSGAAIPASEQADLNEVLSSLYVEDAEIEQYAHELESLVQVHRHLTRDPASSDSRQQIEQQIFWILGLAASAV
ncbi:MAG: hypothetical protein NW237_15115 [Cyanobacteriota bacterium]|nr:hypothetical protein [Cyanobacteriota bacterium]